MKKLHLLVLGGLVLTTSPGLSADAKVYPGAMCLPETGTGVDSSLQYHLGALFNLSTSANKRVACPIVRDNVSSTSVSVKLVLKNPSQIGSFQCRVNGRATDGSFYNGPLESEWQVGEVFTKNLGAASPLTTDMALYVDCLIPQNYFEVGPSAIYSYRVSE